MWPRDSKEVSKPGPIAGVEVVRNLLEVVGKRDRHDQRCTRDLTDCLIPDLEGQQNTHKARNGKCISSSPSLSSLSYCKMALQPTLRPFILGDPAAPHTLDIFRE